MKQKEVQNEKRGHFNRGKEGDISKDTSCGLRRTTIDENQVQRTVLRRRVSLWHKHRWRAIAWRSIKVCDDKDPAKETDPRRFKVPPFVAPGNGKDVEQFL